MKLLKSLIGLVSFFVGAIVVSMMAVGDTREESDGRAVNVDLLHTVAKDEIAVVDGWLGIASADGDSGDTIALDLEDNERAITVPASFDPAKGAIIYIEVADVTGHTPDDTAYGTSAGSGKVAFAKVTRVKDANNVLFGIIIRGNLAS